MIQWTMEESDSKSAQVPSDNHIMDDLSPNGHGPQWDTVLPSAEFNSLSRDCDSGFDVHF